MIPTVFVDHCEKAITVVKGYYTVNGSLMLRRIYLGRRGLVLVGVFSGNLKSNIAANRSSGQNRAQVTIIAKRYTENTSEYISEYSNKYTRKRTFTRRYLDVVIVSLVSKQVLWEQEFGTGIPWKNGSSFKSRPVPNIRLAGIKSWQVRHEYFVGLKGYLKRAITPMGSICGGMFIKT
ncbi:hypothetical protein NQ318_001318 [Aromia moschata]|uniref:Uncharacterized protein n=1 Tax=Aromia moschata TaxID=1265417 RepID=A0AAV8ZHX1_9CUCU|nr:hypothetical protein NQ318_001318 [Aromia moschata]